MDSLRERRIERLHRQFVDAAERFRDLSFAAATPRPDVTHMPPCWPSVPRDDGMQQLGLTTGDWRSVLQKREGEICTPLADRWIQFEDLLWHGAFYNGGTWGDGSQLQEQHQRFMAGIDEFVRLACHAAGQFYSGPTVWRPDHPLRNDAADRWLEIVCGMDFVRLDDRFAFLVKRVPDDIFTASARAIEELGNRAINPPVKSGENRFLKAIEEAGNERESIVSPLSPSKGLVRLRQIPAELLALSTATYAPAVFATTAGDLVWEAYRLGAFERSDPTFDKLRAFIRTQYVNFAVRGPDGPSWRIGVYSEAVICLAPKYQDDREWQNALSVIAGIIREETTRIESSLGRLDWLRNDESALPPLPAVAQADEQHSSPDAVPEVVVQPSQNGNEHRKMPGKSSIEILEFINSGLYGRVYRARQIALDRIVAVKIIKSEWPESADAIQHARAIARVGAHPNIVTVHSVEEVTINGVGDNVPAIVMEWLEGEQLGTRLAGQRFTTQEARRICTGILYGIEHMHAHGICHSDLHLGNVILLADCTPKIIDVDANKKHSLAKLSTLSRDAAVQADIDQCRQIIFRTLSHTNLAVSLQCELDNKLRLADAIESFRLIVEDAATGT